MSTFNSERSDNNVESSSPPVPMVQYIPSIPNLGSGLGGEYVAPYCQSLSYGDGGGYLSNSVGVYRAFEPVYNQFGNDLNVLEHVFSCRSVVCDEECNKMKLKVYHIMMCNGINCRICNEVEKNINFHKEKCQIEDCAVPDFGSLSSLFKDLKSSMKRMTRYCLRNEIENDREIKRREYESNDLYTKPCKRIYETRSSYNNNNNREKNEMKTTLYVMKRSENSESLDNERINNKSGNNKAIETSKPSSSSSLPQTQTPAPKISTNLSVSNRMKQKCSNKNTMEVNWVKCNICGRKRKIPSNVDIDVISPKFKCNLNIWDSKYASCAVAEEVLTDTKYGIIDFSGGYEGYEEEKERFVESLKAFHREHNTNIVVRVPTLGRKEVDLLRLFREVTSRGGSTSVVLKEGTWAKIYRGLENYSPTETSASFRLKKMYTKYLYQYEQFLFHFDNDENYINSNVNNKSLYHLKKILKQREEREGIVNEQEKDNMMTVINKDDEIKEEKVEKIENDSSTAICNIPPPYDEFNYSTPSISAYCPYYNSLRSFAHNSNASIEKGWVCLACSQINKETQSYCICCEALKP